MSATPGTLYGVGIGPGDPELITLKAARIIESADVVAKTAQKYAMTANVSIKE